jgi:hypothetical protein
MPRYAIPVLILAVAAGCRRPAPPPAVLPQIAAGSGSLTGTHFTFGTWSDGKAVLVWSALPAISTGSDTTPSRAGFSGQHLAPDGGQIEWECTTSDGHTGSVVINGDSYELGDGSLFLVDVQGDETNVVQLDRDTLQLTDENIVDTLKDWLANDGEVSAFFADVEPTPEE